MTMHEGQLGQSQKRVPPPFQAFVGYIDGLLGNKAVQTPARVARTSQFWHVAVEAAPIYLGKAEGFFVGARTEMAFPFGNAQELIINAPNFVQSAEVLYVGVRAEMPFPFGNAQELVINAPNFAQSTEVCFLDENEQIPFHFENADVHVIGGRPALAVVQNAESPEMAWLVQNARELGQYKGEWLLIRGEELLAHSRDFAVVRGAIRERQIGSPFVYYVPTDEESNSVTI